MVTNRYIRPRSSLRTACKLSAAVVGLLCGSLLASDPLTMIPADAALVIAFRDLDGSARKLNAFVRKSDADFPGLDLDEVQRGFNLPDGILDTSAPAFIILSRPERQRTAFALAFTPRDPAALYERVSGQDNSVRRCNGLEGPHCLMMREGIAFVGHSRKSLRLFRRVPRAQSLAASLNDQQKALYESSDVFVHIPLSRWREKIKPFIFMTTNLMKIGVAAQQSEEQMLKGTAALVDWLVDGAKTIIDQMETTTLALGFDGETFRLTHHHTFAAGGSVANYLGQVKRPGMEHWAAVPNRPFFVVGRLDWQCPPGLSLAERFRTKIFTDDAIAGTTPADMRRRLADTATAYFGQTLGSYFMGTSPEGKLHPLQFCGGYTVKNAEKGLDQLRFLQENANEAMSAFMGGPYFGKFERHTCKNGMPFLELQFDLEHMSPQVRRQTVALYGENIRFQEGIADEHHLIYIVAQPPFNVCELMAVRTADTHIGTNPLVRKIVSCLPHDPHAVVVVDVGRCLAMAPILLQTSLSSAAQQPFSVDEVQAQPPAQPGPLLGWACVVGPDSLSGRFAISANDLVRMSTAWPDTVVRLRKSVRLPSSTASGSPRDKSQSAADSR